MWHVVILFCLAVLVLPIQAQSRLEKFFYYAKEEKPDSQLVVLREWDRVQHDDPERIVAWFNYYYNKGMQSVILLTKEEPVNRESYSIHDTSGKVTGYLTDTVLHVADTLNLAFQCIDSGITRFPDRLDMRLGEIYGYASLKEFDSATRKIVQTLQHSLTNNNKWFGANNEPYSDGKAVLLETIQDYFKQFATADDSSFVYAGEIAEKANQLYPGRIEFITDLGVVNFYSQKFDKAIEYFQKAEVIDPNDVIVLINMALCYEFWGHNEKAKEYYTKLLKSTDEQVVQTAKDHLKKLNGK
ncbi:MAG: tetratricopeptide repeat protein [Ignavibacteria bacterium]|nr:tetratricopeptide repeat protein [Ignavibacteria bacterium]